MEKEQRKASSISGMFIYRQNSQTMYAPPFSKKGYIITDNDVDSFVFFSSRFITAVSIGIIIAIISQKAWLSICLAVLYYIIMTCLFYFVFLRKLTSIEAFPVKKRPSFISDIITKNSVKTLIIYLFLLLAAGIYFAVNLSQKTIIDSSSYLSYALIIILSLFAGIIVYALIRKINDKHSKLDNHRHKN